MVVPANVPLVLDSDETEPEGARPCSLQHDFHISSGWWARDVWKAHVIGRWLTDCNSPGYKTNWETPLTELGCIPHNYTKDHENTSLFLLYICFEIILSSCTSVRTMHFSRLEPEPDIQPSSTKLRGFVKMRNHVILLTVTLNCMYICMCVYIYDMYIHSAISISN